MNAAIARRDGTWEGRGLGYGGHGNCDVGTSCGITGTEGLRRASGPRALARSTSNSSHLVAELERAEEAGVRLDPEPGLGQRRAPPVPAGAGVGDLQPGRLRLAVEGDRALDGAAAGAGRDDPGRGEGRGAAAQDPADLLLDLPAVPVGERHGPAGPLADLQRAQVEFGADRGGGLAAVVLGGHVDPRRPAGDLDGEVVAGPGGQPGPAGLDDDAPACQARAGNCLLMQPRANRTGSGGKGPAR